MLGNVTLPLLVTPTVSCPEHGVDTLAQADFYSLSDAANAMLSLSLVVAIEGAEVAFDIVDAADVRHDFADVIDAGTAEWLAEQDDY